jgi:hypothetical protein
MVYWCSIFKNNIITLLPYKTKIDKTVIQNKLPISKSNLTFFVVLVTTYNWLERLLRPCFSSISTYKIVSKMAKLPLMVIPISFIHLSNIKNVTSLNSNQLQGPIISKISYCLLGKFNLPFLL